MSDTSLTAPPIRFRSATEESPAARWGMIIFAFAGLSILVFAPLIAVFVVALADGVAASLKSLATRDAREAIRLTLTIAAISVPLNAIFGVAAAWFITKFDFRGKAFLITLIDLPFSVSPVVAGLCIVLMFGTNSLVGGWLVANGYPIVFAMPGIILATMFVTFPFVARELIPVMIEQGRDVVLVDSADATAFCVSDMLREADALRGESNRGGVHRFESSGDIEAFRALGRQLLGPELDVVLGLSWPDSTR